MARKRHIMMQIVCALFREKVRDLFCCSVTIFCSDRVLLWCESLIFLLDKNGPQTSGWRPPALVCSSDGAAGVMAVVEGVKRGL